MRGMTGYGQATKVGDHSKIVVTVSSYNKKILDLSVKLPQTLLEIESEVRKKTSEKVARGALFVSFRVEPQYDEALPNESSLAQVKERLALLFTIRDRFQLNVTDNELFHALFSDSELLKASSPGEELSSIALQAFQDALSHVVSSREQEGHFLQKDLLSRAQTLTSIREAIVEKSRGVVERQIEKWRDHIAKYLPETLLNDERLLKEIILFSDKVDISEELARIEHHLSHFQEALFETASIGKKLDFLLQELSREFNTLGAKTSQIDVSYLVVQAKSELERMREQVQNVE